MVPRLWPLWTAFAFPPGDNLHPFDLNYYYHSTRLDAVRRVQQLLR
jgi:hypothetical protein